MICPPPPPPVEGAVMEPPFMLLPPRSRLFVALTAEPEKTMFAIGHHVMVEDVTVSVFGVPLRDTGELDVPLILRVVIV
jgi:hypothetical protein